ncbi:MAG: hypothetical protein B7X99_16165 [Rhizobiales bacterium 17-65-6]|jgi:hypothetical protein|nr:MAG: hypothetical protein B7Z41_02875 [Rhizobiales bacterium 12-66-7]OYX71907.1 MAG: hypothetical protein B7Y95_11930 [Rhizobiales bacterium 32-66-11]OYY88587.1 MAG: hypothetical protein B7Y61_01855 [Rhizobiales bacterium 35-66-30]OYZ75413.1 MAG: hypothetical protein B7Y12_12680 [Rhizobiales bacterium 24-66-13]OYZ91653.1 MAG: hypothetical protein B7X99_16165 [Rhizobiales bacterium 17-65-6]OZB03658.1 MAG: hypothetical protein B7X67_16390 [Rhizobiales bacterium 39-66-18]
MADDISYDAIVRAEIAIEFLNRARGIVASRIHEIEADDPAAAEELRVRRRALVELQHGVQVADREGVEAIIATWGPRVRDERLFWQEF